MKRNKKIGLSVLLALTCAAFATDYSSWAKYKNLTLSTTGITTTAVTKIPVLVRLSVANQFDLFTGTTAALANGADIRVTKADGTTDLPFEIDSWTTGAKGAGAIWVLLDSVPQNSPSAYSFRIYWNKAGATTISNSAAVFAPSNGFLAVWHFNQASGTPLVDATGNGNTATPGSGAAPTDDSTSVIGMGKTFDGATQFYAVGTDSTALSLNTDNGPYTITAWANSGSCPSGRVAVLSKYANDNSAGSRQYALQTGPTSSNWRLTDDPTSFSTLTANNEFVADAAGTCVPGTWTYLAGTYYSAVTPTADATGAANAVLYVNGGASPTTGVTASQATGTSIGKHSLTYIGKLADNTTPRFMDGPIDELTVSNVVRSDDWINLSYQTQAPASTALTIGASVPPTGIFSQSVAAGFKIQSTGSSVLFQLPVGISGVRISVMDMSGREVWNRGVDAGTQQVSWNGKTAGGTSASGVYLIRVTAAEKAQVLAEAKVMLTP